MNGKLQLYCFIIIQMSRCINSDRQYLHEVSSKTLKCTDTSPGSDFGHTIAYQNSTQPHIVVGAPHDHGKGGVFKCSLDDLLCSKVYINVDKLAPSEGNFAKDRSYCLGASLAVLPDYFVTCAPLWSTAYTEYRKKNSRYKKNVFGQCFVVRKNVTKLKDPLDTYFELSAKEEIGQFYAHDGGTGWNLHIIDDGILVSQSPEVGGFYKVSKDDQLKLLNEHIAFNADTKKYRNIGHTSTVGNFLGKNTYAISMIDDYMYEYVTIYDSGAKKMVKFKEKSINTMFGSALHMADVNQDDCSDLLVGAPAYHDDDFGYEKGAIYIYLGGKPEKYNTNNAERSTILATKDGSRFGSTIDSNDMDGDGIPEIFISAPYEDSGKGCLYILSGSEVKSKLLDGGGSKVILLSELTLTQRVQNEKFKSFGYSFLNIPDLNKNGCGEVVIGSPRSAAASLYNGVPTVCINMTAQRIGQEAVKVKATNFTVHVCVNINYRNSVLKDTISSYLSFSYLIIGPNASLNRVGPSFVEFSELLDSYCEDVTVYLSGEAAGSYKFTADVQLVNEDIEDAIIFNPTWVTLCPESVTKVALEIERKCSDEGDCVPKFDMKLKWTGGSSPKYEVGLSEQETLHVNIRNTGLIDAYEGCVRITVSGAPVYNSECTHNDGQYLCYLPKPLKRDAVYVINMQLMMNKISHDDAKLHVEATVYGSCNQRNTTTYREILDHLYYRSGNSVDIRTFPQNYNITQKDFKDKDVNSEHIYKIINKGFLTWKDVGVKTITQDHVVITVIDEKGESSKGCTEKFISDLFESECTINLLPNSTTVVILTQKVTSEDISTGGVTLNVTSQFELYLKHKQIEDGTDVKRESMTTLYTVQDSVGFWGNKSLVLLIAVLIAVLVILVIMFILYKLGFFKREKKTQLKELRRQSIRRLETQNQKSEDMEIVEDNVENEEMDLVVEEMCNAQNTPVQERKL